MESDLFSILTALAIVIAAWIWYIRPRSFTPEGTNLALQSGVTRRTFAKGGLGLLIGGGAIALGLGKPKNAEAIVSCGTGIECGCTQVGITLSCMCRCDCPGNPCTFCYYQQRVKIYYKCCPGPNGGQTCAEQIILNGKLLFCQCCPGVQPDGTLCLC